MHLKFLKHGKGSGKDAVQYLTQKHDHSGKLRESVDILRGDLQIFEQVVDSLNFTHRYTSGVLSRHKDDKPTNQQIEEVLDSFEKLAFAGLKKDSYSWSAVKHTDPDGSVHVHVVAARQELHTGKSLNIAPPGWAKTFDPLRDFYNKKYSWADPSDPARARLVQPGPGKLFHIKNARKIKEEITNFILNRIENNVVKNRNDVVSSLKELGTVVREGKNYVSIKLEGQKKNIRLKGVIYNDDFDRATFIENKGKNNKRTRNTNGIDTKGIDEHYERFQEAFKKRFEYNIKRYSKKSKRNSKEQQSNTEDIQEERFDTTDNLEPFFVNYWDTDWDFCSKIFECDGVMYDGNGNKISENIGNNAERKNGNATTSASVNIASTNINEASKVLDKCIQRADRCIEGGRNLMQNELGVFKKDINLIYFVQKFGFEKDEIDSNTTSDFIVMRRNRTEEKGSGEKISITVNNQGKWTYHNFRSGQSGSIIDFYQNETNENLGKTRVALRKELGCTGAKLIRKTTKLHKNKDTTVIQQQKENKKMLFIYKNAKVAYSSYLKNRNIDEDIQEKIGNFKIVEQNKFNNVVFPLYNINGICGISERNTDFKRVQGRKGIWYSKKPENCNKFVFVESAIDAMAHAKLNGFEAQYISVEGNFSKDAAVTIEAILKKNNELKVILAFDNDPAGENYNKKMLDIAKKMGITARIERPTGVDWADDLDEKNRRRMY